jgi:hypothetical protein
MKVCAERSDCVAEFNLVEKPETLAIMRRE